MIYLDVLKRVPVYIALLGLRYLVIPCHHRTADWYVITNTAVVVLLLLLLGVYHRPSILMNQHGWCDLAGSMGFVTRA